MAGESFRLAAAHRLAQAQIGAETVALMDRLYPTLDLSSIEGTAGRWLAVTVPVVQAQASRSARLAADYLAVSHRLDVGELLQFTPTIAIPNQRRIATSLHVTGPARVRKLSAEGYGMATVRRSALIATSRSAMRLALDGGRDTIVGTMRQQRGVGWSRVTSGSPCAFCAMLASRGPVYSGEHSASFQAHDGCACSAMAAWNRDQGWTPQARQYRELWDETTEGLSGNEALSAFRSLVESDSITLPLAA